MKIDETLFNQAVTITAAFVANGDIRCGGSTRDDSTAMAQVGDMVSTVYRTLSESREYIRSIPEDV